jgi:ubiquinone/menaquinone biosynthesis C-methylase UbiE
VDDPSPRLIRQAGYERVGFAETYDRNRPAPPAVLLDVLTRAAAVERPTFVVDLGSGTGLSTRAWAERADEVVGVEPQEPMRERAAAVTEAPNVRYVEGWSYATGLPDASADVVTCSQSFHWMEPEATLDEAARILRPGGVFAVYDYEVPPFVHPEVDAAFDEYLNRRREARARLGIPPADKTRHLERIEASGHFRFARRLLLHGEEDADAERVVGYALSIGPVLEELDETLVRLRETAERALGDGTVRWVAGYFVYFAVK